MTTRPSNVTGVVLADSEADSKTESPQVWVLFDSPKDMPGYFVLRRFIVTNDLEALGNPEALGSPEAFWCRDAEPLRAKMRERGLTCIPRNPDDEPHIVETWI